MYLNKKYEVYNMYLYKKYSLHFYKHFSRGNTLRNVKLTFYFVFCQFSGIKSGAMRIRTHNQPPIIPIAQLVKISYGVLTYRPQHIWRQNQCGEQNGRQHNWVEFGEEL